MRILTYFTRAILLPDLEQFDTLIFTFFVAIAIIQTSRNNYTICISAIIPLDIFFNILKYMLMACVFLSDLSDKLHCIVS